jgi:UDP-3-O-acyl N-acetylglucosamine deacetylase
MSLKDNQGTIARETQVSGIGLHTGNKCKAIFKPAAENTGVTLVRTDLPGHPRIAALYTNVVGVIRGTTVGNESLRVHTIEHMLSAVYALGLDNLIIEMDANEPPVVDGSSQAFYDALKNAGLIEQSIPKKILKITEFFEYRDKETIISVEPAEGLKLSVEIQFAHPLIRQQKTALVMEADAYRREISPARTFCFDYEVEQLKKHGLAKGGSLENAVVVGLDRIHNKEKALRFPDEFVRHKTLDLLGDLFLLGYRLEGHVTALRPGHGHNVNFIRALAEKYIPGAPKFSELTPVSGGM